MSQEMKAFTPEELAASDGKDGRPAYLAFEGRVIDVGASKMWRAGRHMNRHSAGTDQSGQLAQAPHGPEMLDRYPQVGVLAGAPVAAQAAPDAAAVADGGAGRKAAASGGDAGRDDASELPWLLRKNPFLRRHPHPMTVHFPIAFATGAAVCMLLFLYSGLTIFGYSVYGLMLLGALFTPVAVLTGLLTWRYNYGQRLFGPVLYKLVLSPVLWLGFLWGTGWWIVDPDALAEPGGYAVLVFALLPVMGVIGWFGSTLTFPIHD